MPEDEGVDSRFMKKTEVYGATLIEVAQERERQIKAAPHQPSVLSELITAHMATRDEAAIAAQMRESARLRANPKLRRKVPTTEMELLVAGAPKTSAQVVGYHEVPHVAPLPETAKAAPSELEKMRRIFPRTECGVAGFHTNFAAQAATEATEMSTLIGGLSAAQVAADPKMASALAKIKRRTTDLGRMCGSDGVPRGVAYKSSR